MSALVDTSIWSLALRRETRGFDARERRLVEQWRELVTAGEALLIGPIRQEILSGIRAERTFNELANWLRYFDLIELQPGDFDQAARFFNALRSKGVTGTPTDMLMSAVAHRCEIPIFTIDGDFGRFARHLPLQLLS